MWQNKRLVVYGVWLILFWIVFVNVKYLSLQKRQLEDVDMLCNPSVKEWTLTRTSNQVYQQGVGDNRGGQTFSVNSSIYKIKPSNLMTLQKLNFLSNYKNPCFHVKDPPENDGGVWVTNDTALKCWPYFQLIGVEKCGTSDLFEKLHLHHHLRTMINQNNGKVIKESLWYNGFIRAEPHNHTLGGYLGMLDNGTRYMYQQCKDNLTFVNGSQCPYIMSDFSARTINHNYYWYKDEPNQQYYFPKYMSADKVYHVWPKTKILVMLRNPTERIFSDYKFYRGAVFKHPVTPEDFHTRIVLAIQAWNHCTYEMRVDPEKCAEGYNWTLSIGTKRPTYWTYRSPDRIRIGLYSLYLKRWLQLFPKENIHVIQLEEYAKSPLDYIERHVLPFLGLEPYRKETREYIESINLRQNNKNTLITTTMWNSTRAKLNAFYAPYNFQLFEMLNDKKFLWKD